MRIAVAVCGIFAVVFGVDATVYFKEQFLDGGKRDFDDITLQCYVVFISIRSIRFDNRFTILISNVHLQVYFNAFL